MTKNQEEWKSGQSFEDYLKDRGLYEIVTIHALASYLIDLNLEQSEINQTPTESNEYKQDDVG